MDDVNTIAIIAVFVAVVGIFVATHMGRLNLNEWVKTVANHHANFQATALLLVPRVYKNKTEHDSVEDRVNSSFIHLDSLNALCDNEVKQAHIKLSKARQQCIQNIYKIDSEPFRVRIHNDVLVPKVIAAIEEFDKAVIRFLIQQSSVYENMCRPLSSGWHISNMNYHVGIIYK